MPVVVLSETLAVAGAGTPAPNVVPQALNLAAVSVDDDVAVAISQTNTPLALGTIDLAVVTLETILVL